LRVVAMRPTLTAPARGAGGQPGRGEGAVTSDRTKELDEGKKGRLELDAGDRITEWDRNPNGPRPAAGGARARGPLQARAVGPGRGRKAAGRRNRERGYPRNPRAGSG